MKTHQRLLVLIIFLVPTVKVYAFPDTIRHGYTSCSTCHVSPAGGGLLSHYGRSLSNELMSTWATKDEELPLHGLVKIPESVMEKFFVGGDVRYLSRKVDSANSKVNEGFLMQAQLRLGLVLEKLKFLITIGKLENPRASSQVKTVGTEYYTLWSIKEDLHLRFGRFEPVFGLRMPDHNLWVKSEIGFVPWAERDGAEFFYEGETQSVTLAGFQSTSAMPTAQQNTGHTLSFYQVIGENKRVGLSALNSEGQGVRSRVVSAHGSISFSKKSYSLIEYSRSWTTDVSKDLAFIRYGYEVAKGFTPILQAQGEFTRTSPTSDATRFGGGFIWLPRPHFELMGLVEQQKIPAGNSTEAFLLFHYYL